MEVPCELEPLPSVLGGCSPKSCSCTSPSLKVPAGLEKCGSLSPGTDSKLFIKLSHHHQLTNLGQIYQYKKTKWKNLWGPLNLQAHSGPAPQDSALRPQRLGVQRSVPPQLQKRDNSAFLPHRCETHSHIVDIIDRQLHEDIPLYLTSIHPFSNFTKLPPTWPTCHRPPAIRAEALDPNTPRPCSPTLWRCSWCRCRSPSGGSRTCWPL